MRLRRKWGDSIFKILTQQISWQDQFSLLKSHDFFYHAFNCEAETLHDICLDKKIDLILCCDFEVQSKFSLQASKVLELKLPWLLPSYESSEMENKFNFHAKLKKSDLSAYLPPQREINEYPYLLKIGNGYGGKYVYAITSQKDLQQLKYDLTANPYICQEYIHGDEYVHHFIALNGVCKIDCTYQHIYDGQIASGDLYIRGRDLHNEKIKKVVLDKKYLNVLQDLINKIGFTGWGCIDFKIFRDKLYIFELNSRIGGSLVFYPNTDFDQFVNCYLDTLSHS